MSTRTRKARHDQADRHLVEAVEAFFADDPAEIVPDRFEILLIAEALPPLPRGLSREERADRAADDLGWALSAYLPRLA